MGHLSCYQCVKDKNFESNSQLVSVSLAPVECCYQCVKDKNFESNSQRFLNLYFHRFVVISVSKIKISKAIHNYMVSKEFDDTLLSVCQR